MRKNYILAFISTILTLLIFLNIKYTSNVLLEVYILWYKNILPTIPVSYFLGNILYYNNIFTSLLYKVIKKFLSFESKISFNLFLISFIVGNPSSTILITNAYNNNLISLNETTRLLRFSSFISIFFILFVFDKVYSIPLILGSLTSSFILNKTSKIDKDEKKINLENIDLFYLIKSLPSVLLTILSTMLICTIIKIPFNIIFPNSIYLIPTFLSFFEITSGITRITSLYSGVILIFFSSMLLSTHGIAILLQVILKLKEKMLNVKDYLKYRIINSLLATTFSILFYLLIIFLF